MSAEEEFNILRTEFGEANNVNLLTFGGFCAMSDTRANTLMDAVTDVAKAGRLAELRQHAKAPGNLIKFVCF